MLHDLGAISTIVSDSRVMGRVGEVVLRSWPTAHVMKRLAGPGVQVIALADDALGLCGLLDAGLHAVAAHTAPVPAP